MGKPRLSKQKITESCMGQVLRAWLPGSPVQEKVGLLFSAPFNLLHLLKGPPLAASRWEGMLGPQQGKEKHRMICCREQRAEQGPRGHREERVAAGIRVLWFQAGASWILNLPEHSFSNYSQIYPFLQSKPLGTTGNPLSRKMMASYVLLVGPMSRSQHILSKQSCEGELYRLGVKWSRFKSWPTQSLAIRWCLYSSHGEEQQLEHHSPISSGFITCLSHATILPAPGHTAVNRTESVLFPWPRADSSACGEWEESR